MQIISYYPTYAANTSSSAPKEKVEKTSSRTNYKTNKSNKYRIGFWTTSITESESDFELKTDAARKNTNKRVYNSAVAVDIPKIKKSSTVKSKTSDNYSLSKLLVGISDLFFVSAICIIFCFHFLKQFSNENKYNFVIQLPEISYSPVLSSVHLDVAMKQFTMDFGTSTMSYNNSAFVDSDGNILNVSVESETGIDNVAVTSVADSESVTPAFLNAVTYTEYKVKSGDTISGITLKFNLKNISTLIAVNDISNVRSLKSGQVLKIPSMDGLIHSISAGETLESLSVKYDITVEDLLDVNDLSSQDLMVGDELFIPGAKLDNMTLHSALGDLFISPIARSYRITSYFGRRPDPFTGVPSSHSGIDLAVPLGTPIRSSMAGRVVYAGFSNIYGNYVIINHGNGYQTLYGHMYKILTRVGQYIEQGTQIGLVGSTGYSTGPHLHFSVYKDGKLIDPLSVLK